MFDQSLTLFIALLSIFLILFQALDTDTDTHIETYNIHMSRNHFQFGRLDETGLAKITSKHFNNLIQSNNMRATSFFTYLYTISGFIYNAIKKLDG